MFPPCLIKLRGSDVETVCILFSVQYDVERIEGNMIARLEFFSNVAWRIRAEDDLLIVHLLAPPEREFPYSSKRTCERQPAHETESRIPAQSRQSAAVLIIKSHFERLRKYFVLQVHIQTRQPKLLIRRDLVKRIQIGTKIA
ncbi:hypothetical protein SDC9_135702 [bioreactor metagenome]|uniref:Uncharacterized protein n=1 Tax=bioreactor metagenome TaxID=1076179 RepID=A0A645DHV7_9ZZZZ